MTALNLLIRHRSRLVQVVRGLVCGFAFLVAAFADARADGQPARSAEPRPEGPAKWLTLPPSTGPGLGKSVVLIAGDEEYRSEEALPMLARILARRHGFSCNVLFAQNEDGTVNPDRQDNIPGLHLLADADLMVLFTRFRRLPDDQMRAIDDYLRQGKPVIGIRTATHAFALPHDSTFGYFSHDFPQAPYEGGFGRRVLGERWVSHHGDHGSESTRGRINPTARKHPILKGIDDGSIWGPTDVYGVRLPLPDDSAPLVLGEVLAGMDRDSAPVPGPKNDPLMPIAWTKSYTWQDGPVGRSFAMTIGASQDFESEDLRRLFVNACYWSLGIESAIPDRSNVDVVGEYDPTPFGFGAYRKGQRVPDE